MILGKLRVWVRFVGATASVALAVGSIARGAEEPRPADAPVKRFLNTYCLRCHNVEKRTSGVRVDHLGTEIEDRQQKLWEGIRKQIVSEAMPPEDEPQPTAAEREAMDAWIRQALVAAGSRPTPKNGGARRLTVAQYRNTLRELLGLEEDLTDILPPDAVSRDGFVNNQETLALSPLLIEAYLEVAEKALEASLVDPKARPTIQRFRVELGQGINRDPCPDSLILGANSLLLDNRDFTVTEPTLAKPFAFEPFRMRTKHRFIEGYAGNDTVRGWRDYDSIYHSVFACMRGSPGYPKGLPYESVPGGLLLRPAIPNDELFDAEGTYGPKANFKISLRELPDHGRFHVTVTAAKYRDGLILDAGSSERIDAAGAVVRRDPESPGTVTVEKAGIYQVDVVPVVRRETQVTPDGSKLDDGLLRSWPLDGSPASRPEGQGGRLVGDARFVPSPFGRGVVLDGDGDGVEVAHHEALHVGAGDFTVAAWVNPQQLRQSGIVSFGKYGWTQGWILDMPDDKGVLRLETAGPDNQPNGTVQSPAGTLRANAWQHVAAVVRRGGETRLFVNGYAVAGGRIGPANLDNPRLALQIGRIDTGFPFRGWIDEVRLYGRALGEAEIQALVEPGRKFVQHPPADSPEDITLTLGGRRFSARWQQPAFLAVRLDAGELAVHAKRTGPRGLARVVLTPLPEDDDLAKRFATFEQRLPKLGVHLGLRRDCGSTLTQVGEPQVVGSETLTKYVFEGAIRDYPSPDVEKDNVNYLAGIREIGVRSEYTDGRDMPRLLIRSVEFEGPYYDAWPPASHRTVFIDSEHKADPAAYARDVIRTFATRAFRRPVTSQEEAALFAVFDRSTQADAGWPEAVRDALQVVLTTPQFLMLIENSTTPAAEPLDEYELASKLSYFLWNGPPDPKTLDLATAGKLRERLNAEVDRLIDDPRFSRFTEPFVSQWLALDKFQVLEPDKVRFPKLSRDARAQLRNEPIRFVEHLFRRNRPLRDLLASDYVVANEVVASYYDLGDRLESGFRFEAIPHGRPELGGLLSQAAVLAGLSDGRESNPVKRGAWLARRIIAEPPDDPPPNVPALKEETKGLSLRQRIEQHRNQRGCVQCHSKIDPWGIPFEEFDAGGRKKTGRVDARSTLPDKTEVAGFDDLRRYLSVERLDQVAYSVLQHLTTYATGRTLSQNELALLKRDGVKLRLNGYPMREMIRYVVQSPMFLEK